MKISPRWKKWIKRFLILMVVRVVISGILYYLVVYKFKEVVQVALKKESKGLYAFDARQADFSLFNKDLIIYDARVYCTDTLHTPLHYDLLIPRIHLSIQSWKELIFHQRLIVDSLLIKDAVINAHAHRLTQNKGKASIKFSQILDALNNIALHLQVVKLNIENGSYRYSNIKIPNQFLISHINFQIHNFSKKYIKDHVFSSEDMDLTLKGQHWDMPDGKHDITFSRLHFNGKREVFELDSCVYHAAATKDKGGITLKADRFYFNSTKLTSIYSSRQLSIDTLICINPRLIIQQQIGPKKQNQPQISVNQTLKHLFQDIHFKFIDIQGGQVQLASTMLTKKASLRIYNLNIPSDSAARIRTDSIKLNLEHLVFVTRDSMFQLSINKFSIVNGDLILHNASYGPTKKNHLQRGLSFTTPSLVLKDIHLGPLLDKKINAAGAVLFRPLITITGKTPIKAAKPQGADTSHSMSQVYKTLHGLKELFTVPEFTIVDGRVTYRTIRKKGLQMNMLGVEAKLIPDHLFRSDSLVDIKRSIPLLQIRNIYIDGPAFNLKLKNYYLEGVSRRNHLQQMDLALANGSHIAGKNIFWEVLDWDLYQQSKLILFYQLRFSNLDINLKTQKKLYNHQQKEIPRIQIKRLEVDHLHVIKSLDRGKLEFEGSKLCTDQIASTPESFNWANTEVEIQNLNAWTEKLQADIKSIHFNNLFGSSASGIQLKLQHEKSIEKILIPELKIDINIQSTAISGAKVNTLFVNKPLFELTAIAGNPLRANSIADKAFKKTSKESNPLNKSRAEKKPMFPLDLEIAKGEIFDGLIRIDKPAGKDTIAISSKINMQFKDLKTFKTGDRKLIYNKLKFQFASLDAKTKTIDIKIPDNELNLSNGTLEKVKDEKPLLSTAIFLKWNNAALKIHTDSIAVTLNKLDGLFELEHFKFGGEQKNQILNDIHNLRLQGNGIDFSTKKLTIKASAFNWNPKKQNLEINSFNLRPKAEMDEAFKNSHWQTDYITLKAPLILVHGINFISYNFIPGSEKQQIHINAIILNHMNLSASRNKSYPFKHGTEKEMPTKLLRRISFPFRLDSVIVRQGSVMINENTPKGNKWGNIPLEHLNAYIAPLTNRNTKGEHLVVKLNGNILDKTIKSFYYSESYGDSLSSFTASSNLGPMSLTGFSKITIPLAAIQVQDGFADLLSTTWKGNKYAAIGAMDFKYHQLKVRLLNALDSSNPGFKLNLENSIASRFILHGSNSQPATVYFERDREKFIFNYWIKTEIKGIQSSIGLKSSKQYQKQYDKSKMKFSLKTL